LVALVHTLVPMGRILNEFHVLHVIWPFILSLWGNDMCFLVPSFYR
jgi:hypothetical protein